MNIHGSIVCFLFSILSALISNSASAASATSPEGADAVEITYEIEVRIDPVAHSIEGRSVIMANSSLTWDMTLAESSASHAWR